MGARLRSTRRWLAAGCAFLTIALCLPAADAPNAGPTAAVPAFPTEGVHTLLAGLESMMVTGNHRKLDELVWDGLPSETRDAWRDAMKHEFRQIAYKPYQTSIYDWRYIPPDTPRENPAIPANLPPNEHLWAVRVDIDYRYYPKSRGTTDTGASAEDRDEQATVLFYLLETDAGVRIVASDRSFFLQFGQALPRGLIGAWAIGLIGGFLALVFWVTMASHCWAARPKLRAWRWIIAAVPLLGAVAYFFWVYWRHPRRPLISLSLLDSWRQALVGTAAPATAPATALPPQPPQPPPNISNPRAAALPAALPPAAAPAPPPSPPVANGTGKAPRE